MQTPNVLCFPFVHVGKISKDVSNSFFLLENVKHFKCSVSVYHITVLRSHDLFTFVIVHSSKIFVVDVFDVNPLNFEVSFKFQCVIFPPKGKSFLLVA